MIPMETNFQDLKNFNAGKKSVILVENLIIIKIRTTSKLS